MSAKEVTSALSILTSNGLKCCQDLADNYFVEAFIVNYFTGSTDDEVSKVSSDDDLTGTFRNNLTIHKC